MLDEKKGRGKKRGRRNRETGIWAVEVDRLGRWRTRAPRCSYGSLCRAMSFGPCDHAFKSRVFLISRSIFHYILVLEK